VADKEKARDWDREMAEVDKLLAKLPEADPYLKGDKPAVAHRPAAAGGAPAPGALDPAATRRAWLGTWARVALGLLIGIGMTQWPYTHGCGIKLWFYLTGVAAVIVAGLWSSITSWKRRMGRAHVLSQALIIWGLVLAAREVLPRANYAKAAATWFCPEPAPTPPAPAPQH
jgi:hypothetical protein